MGFKVEIVSNLSDLKIHKQFISLHILIKVYDFDLFLRDLILNKAYTPSCHTDFSNQYKFVNKYFCLHFVTTLNL